MTISRVLIHSSIWENVMSIIGASLIVYAICYYLHHRR